MNRKLCAPADRARSWESIDWKKAEAYVKKLQMRIVKAQQEGHYSKVKTLQWLLTHSFYAKALAVKRVTSNKGKNTAGVDHELWENAQKANSRRLTNSNAGAISPNLSDGCISRRKTENYAR